MKGRLQLALRGDQLDGYQLLLQPHASQAYNNDDGDFEGEYPSANSDSQGFSCTQPHSAVPTACFTTKSAFDTNAYGTSSPAVELDDLYGSGDEVPNYACSTKRRRQSSSYIS
jgi:hypothetical protein